MPPARPAPTFALSRAPTHDDDTFATWQRDIAAGRLGARPDDRAANAAAEAMERVFLGPRATRWWRA